MVAAVHNEYLTKRSHDNRYRLGVWVALAGIIMLFTSLTSAYIVRAASANDWQPLPLPKVLLLSTAVIVISSATLEAARRKLKASLQRGYVRWLSITAVLGATFLAMQLLAWRQLARQGVYLATSPRSSFFYLLTAVHSVHLLGGLLVLSFLILRFGLLSKDELAQAKSRAATDAASLYWHFMDGLWIYLFLLLFFWR